MTTKKDKLLDLNFWLGEEIYNAIHYGIPRREYIESKYGIFSEYCIDQCMSEYYNGKCQCRIEDMHTIQKGHSTGNAEFIYILSNEIRRN